VCVNNAVESVCTSTIAAIPGTGMQNLIDDIPRRYPHPSRHTPSDPNCAESYPAHTTCTATVHARTRGPTTGSYARAVRCPRPRTGVPNATGPLARRNEITDDVCLAHAAEKLPATWSTTLPQHDKNSRIPADSKSIAVHPSPHTTRLN
jgi:hypothetical protein